MEIVMEYDYMVFIGRFQPVHSGHIRVIQNALKKSKHLIICIGSANATRTPRNPFSYEERVKLIQHHLNGSINRITFVAIDDMLYTENEWIDQVPDDML